MFGIETTRPRRRLLGLSSLAVLSALSLAGPATAAKPKAAPPRITGMWLMDPADFQRKDKPPLTPAAQAAADAQKKAIEQQGKVLSDNNKKCLPTGMPSMMTNEFALEFLETPGRVTILSEMSSLPRSVYLNRKTHTADVEPSWNGHSIGHWEGPVLVIDTVNLNDRISHVPHGGLASGDSHIVERYHLENGGKDLVGEMTFEDPKVLTQPWTVKHTYHRLAADAELWEYACEVGADGWSDRFEGDTATPKSGS